MDTNKHGLKTELRSKIRQILKDFSSEKRESDSGKLCAQVKEQVFFQNAVTVLFFAPLPTEVDLWPLLEESLAEKKIAALPHYDSESQTYIARRVKNLSTEIFAGKFCAREPHSSCEEISLAKIDLVLVPGIAFDLHGHRLGRGQGFYDRLLQNIRGVKCGIAFDEQIAGEIPVESHDARMDFILTPTRCVKIES